VRPQPSVSVIVPVKGSRATIRECVTSLLAQDYGGEMEVILVGDVHDATWAAIEDYIQCDSVIVLEADIATPCRDANAKRNLGLQRATGEVLALTDSDMIMPRNWIARGVELLRSGWACVGGEMHSEARGLWNHYIDSNPIAAKTPRMDPPYLITAANKGVGRHKFPITANVLFTRDVLDRVGGFDDRFVWSYEDYEFFERVVDAGFPILCTSQIAGRHYHRQGLRRLLREYRRSGRGCAQFIAKFPRSRFTQRRLAQLACLLLCCGSALAVPSLRLVVAGAFFALMGLTAIKMRHLAGLLFPLLTLVFGVAFAWGLSHGLVCLVISAKPAPVGTTAHRIILSDHGNHGLGQHGSA
jgi:succinoglycan biosynthesis protein ExoA